MLAAACLGSEKSSCQRGCYDHLTLRCWWSLSPTLIYLIVSRRCNSIRNGPPGVPADAWICHNETIAINEPVFVITAVMKPVENLNLCSWAMNSVTNHAVQDRSANVYKVLHDSAPRYLGPLVAVADLPGRRALRSASTSRLVIPPIKLSILSAAVPFRLLQLKFGTVCQRPSSYRHHCSLFGVN